jgi:hypothetical protein
MAIYDMATAIRQPDASGFGQGLLTGQQFAQGRRQNQARNALARLAQGDQTALPDLMQADPEAGMKWQETQRAEETRTGLQGFFKPATGATNVVGVNSLSALANGQPAQPASYDFDGAMSYAAGRGDTEKATALAQLRDKMSPAPIEVHGTTREDTDGNIYALGKNGQWIPAPFKAKPEGPKTVGGFLVDPVTGQIGAPLPRTPAQIAADERAESAAARQQALLERLLKNDNKPDTLDLKERAQIEQSYRKEFNALNTAYNEIKRSRGNILSSLQQNSAAGDLAAATSLMKMLDPGSVVRESELGMAQNATGAIDRVYNYAQMLSNGQRLNPQQRKEYVQLANDLFANSDNEFKTRADEYTRVAKDYGLKPENIVGTAAANPVPGWKSAGYKNILEAHADYKRARDSAYKAGNYDIVRKLDAEARADGVIK